MLCCVVLCCVVLLFCAVLFCSVLFCSVLFCSVPFRFVSCRVVSCRVVSCRVVSCRVVLLLCCVVLFCLCFTVSLFFNACDVTTKLAPDAPPPRRKKHKGSAGLKPTREQQKLHSRQLEAATFTGAVKGHFNSSSDSVAGNGQLILHVAGGVPA